MGAVFTSLRYSISSIGYFFFMKSFVVKSFR